MVQRQRSLIRLAATRSAALLLGTAMLLGAALLLGGCFSPAPRPPVPPTLPPTVPPSGAPIMPPAGSSTQPPRPPQTPRENHLSPATRSLVTQARRQAAGGDLDGASLTLDRALRIEPNNPLIWAEFGKVRLAENDSHQAEVCARKALALASGDRAAQAQAGRVLIDALRAQGRNQEAHEIESQAFMQ